LAIGETLLLRANFKENEVNIENTADVPQKLSIIKKDISKWDIMIGGISEVENKQQAILNELSSYCINKRLTVREIPKSHTIEENDFLVETDFATIEGNYFGLLNLLNEFEKKPGLGKIVSAELKTNNDNYSHKKYLTLTIYFQNFKKIKQ
jgi:hypothetical protein